MEDIIVLNFQDIIKSRRLRVCLNKFKLFMNNNRDLIPQFLKILCGEHENWNVFT